MVFMSNIHLEYDVRQGL